MSFFLSPYHPCSPLAALLLRLFVIVCSIPLLRILVSPVDFGPQDYICLKSSQVIVTSLPRKWYKTCNSSESQGSSQVLIMLCCCELGEIFHCSKDWQKTFNTGYCLIGSLGCISIVKFYVSIIYQEEQALALIEGEWAGSGK
ncbi:hypothetical protein B0H14DRAFT_2579419 [Mycena olivaceomarginata]|nr:hypothetical protein B0H14DRAFT_2579419 [Mycena olivaceomarginata]